MEILVTICARGGSKGIPGKNIKDLNGKPLLAYTIAHAKAFSTHFPCDITFSTDDESIKKVGEEYGLFTDYNRPEDLANDTAGKIPVIKAVVMYEELTRNKKYDYILDLDVSAPMRTQQDLLEGFEVLKMNPGAYNIFSVSPAHKNPYFNMVECAQNGYYNVSKPLPASVKSRQEAPSVYEMNASFYFYTQSFFEENLPGAITEKSLVYQMKHECFDLDQPLDFEFLDFLLREDKLDFKI